MHTRQVSPGDRSRDVRKTPLVPKGLMTGDGWKGSVLDGYKSTINRVGTPVTGEL